MSTWFRFVSFLAQTEIASGNQVLIVDVSRFSFPSGNGNVGKLKSKKLKSFLDHIKRLGAEYLDLADKFPPAVISPRDIALQFNYEEQVSSHLSTLLRDEEPTSRALGRFFRKKILRLLISLHVALNTQLLDLDSFENVYVPSGRSPNTRLLGDWAKENSLTVKWVERGMSNSGLFVENYRIHDRVAIQLHFNEWMKNYEGDYQIGADWLAKRAELGSPNNPFSKNFRATNGTTKHENLFFPSSPDEYMHLGEEWQGVKWGSFFESVREIMNLIDPTGSNSAIRLHPILDSKSFHQIARVKKECLKLKTDFPELTFYEPSSEINSYELLESAKRVFVHRSHLTLEAIYRSIPVWVTGRDIFDSVVGCRSILGPEEVTLSNLEMYQPDPILACAFVTFLFKRDIDISDLNFPDQFKPGTGSRLPEPFAITSFPMLLINRALMRPWVKISKI